jgi:hypothetical protein
MPVLTHILLFWKIPLDGSIGGVSVFTKPLDEGLDRVDIREAGSVT